MLGRKTIGIALVAGVLGIVSPASAVPVIYDFTGALTVGGTVHGSFTLDAATASILAFSLTTPTGLVDPAHYTSTVVQYVPATSPAANFVSLAFNGITNAAYDHLHLLFQTTLASFNGGNFYFASGVSDATGSDASSLICFAIAPVNCVPPAGLVFGGGFTSGAATAEAAADGNAATEAPLAAVPEPTSLVLSGFGLLALGAWSRRRGPQSLDRPVA